MFRLALDRSSNLRVLVIIQLLLFLHGTFAHSTNVSISTELEMSTAGQYYGKVLIGTPPTSLKLIMATGGESIAVVSSTCTDCRASTVYNLSVSSTGAPVPCSVCTSSCSVDNCEFTGSFSGGTLTGIMAYDYVEYDGVKLNMTFEMIEHEKISNPVILKDMDGIFGLGGRYQSFFNPNSFLANLANAGQANNSYGLCLGQFGGYLNMGYKADEFHNGLKWVAMLDVANQFSIADFQVDGKDLVPARTYNPGVLDTTSSSIVFSTELFTAFLTYINETYCADSSPPNGLCEPHSIFTGGCLALTSDDLERFPNFNITLVEASSSKYFALSFSGMDYTVPNADGLTCSGISSHSDSKVKSTVLGANVFRKLYIEFDFDKLQLGFGYQKKDCSGAQYIISKHSGGNQEGTLGSQLSFPFEIKVLNASTLQPVKGITVTFAIIQGDATISTQVTTDHKGIASAYLQLGTHTGTIFVTASVDQGLHSPILFQATARETDSYLLASGICLVVLALLFTGNMVCAKKFKDSRERRKRRKLREAIRKGDVDASYAGIIMGN